jgi:hypothetical protein
VSTTCGFRPTDMGVSPVLPPSSPRYEYVVQFAEGNG